MIATDQKFRSRYGYWESSIKWGDTNGMWSAFWMQSPTMGANLNDPAVSGSEIDIAEHRFVDGGNNNIANQVQVNIHWNGYGSSGQSSGSGNVGAGLGTGFHTHGILWTPNSYSVSIDGSQVYNGGSSPVSHSTEWAILSSEVDDTSTTWAGIHPRRRLRSVSLPAPPNFPSITCAITLRPMSCSGLAQPPPTGPTRRIGSPTCRPRHSMT